MIGNWEKYDITKQNVTKEKEILLEVANNISNKLLETLNDWVSVKIPDRYVAELVEVLKKNYNYILNIDNEEKDYYDLKE